MNTLSLDMSRSLDVIAMGRASVDFVPDTYGPTAENNRYTKFLGGSPANTAVAMAQQGIRVSYIGKVGQDILGDYLRAYMAGKGIDVSHIAVCSDPARRTGLSVAELLAPNQKRSNLYRTDVADLHIDMQELDEAHIAGAKLLLVSGASLSDSPAREAVFLAMEYARRNGTRVAFDPDYRAQSWLSREQTSMYYHLAMEKCDLLLATQEEMAVLHQLFLPGESDDRRWAAACLERGVSLVVIKRGELGSVAFDRTGREYREKAFPSRVISLQGAGDSYSGSFISRLVRGGSVEEAMRYGAASAALTVSGRSCSEHMPSLSLTEDFLQACDQGRIEQWQWWE